jgi:SAM-dependent methyltransferase
VTPDEIDLQPVADLYTESLRAHGPTPPGAGWRSADAQDLRFERLLTVVDDDAEFDVNDLGCGYGALFHYLQRCAFPVQRYRGYDISPAMLHAARRQLPAGRCEVVAGDRIAEEADYSFASGIFNVRLAESEERWTAYVREVVRNLAGHSRRGFAFNVLSTYCDHREDHLYYGDPLEWFDWCKTEIAPRVALLHDYPLYEWTLTARWHEKTA